ncbi:Predicted O-antigen polymerase [gamma proteobacterium HdN1]|nr:Predicted O-antigen polymerase [gamma proteobacterium HdN1]
MTGILLIMQITQYPFTLEGGRTPGKLLLPAGIAYLSLLVAGLCAIEMDFARVADRRMNYPIFFALTLPLLLLAVRNVLHGSFYKIRLFTLALVAYAAWCGLSALWAPSSMETLMHAIIMGITVLLAMGAAPYSSRETILIFAKVSLLIFIASWVALVVSPAYALEKKGIWRLCGVMMHEFRLGYLCSVAMISCMIWLCMSDAQQRPSLPFIFILGLAAVVTLFATQTRSLLIYTFLCVCLVGVLHLKGGMRMAFIGMLALSCLLLGVFSDEVMQMMSRGEADGTLTGRTFVWERTLSMVPEALLRGHGFASFDNTIYDSAWGGYRAPHAHNAWIMALFETGVVGTVLMSAVLLFLLVQSFRLSFQLGRPSFTFYVTLLGVMSSLTGLIYGGKMATLMGLSFVLFYQENRERVEILRQRSGAAAGRI